jgi:hypothetical protein
MPYDFAGVKEKLKRTNENIRNIESEVAAFFKESEYPVLPEDNTEMLLKAIQYHRDRKIPPRFSVLAGEIVHHLRSCLDHIVWQLSSSAYRKKHRLHIAFPVFTEKPVDKEKIASYERKIKGITDPDVVGLIEHFQPYNSPDPTNTYLYIVHNFDRIDKHRELVLCFPTGAREFPPDLQSFVARYQREHPELRSVEVAINLKAYGKLVPQIAFKEFGRREVQPVVQGLMELNNFIVTVIAQFAQL